MLEIRKTEDFETWLSGLRDRVGKAKIISRIQRLELGNAGNVRAVGEGVSEMKIDFGPGYRVYYKQIEKMIVLLLCGGDKSTQDKDIKRAKQIAAEL